MLTDYAISIPNAFYQYKYNQGDFGFIEVATLAELETILLPPPALAYVREVGDFYFRHGPEYWFGQIGTQAAGWSDRESDRWIRSCYTGDRAIIQATDIGRIKESARTTLINMILRGPTNFTSNVYGVSYWNALAEAFTAIINTTFVETNVCTCDREGTRLYDIEAGDISTEDNGAFIQAKTKLPMQRLLRYGYVMQQCATKPIIIGTPGLHIHRQRQRTSFMDCHPERVGYIVTRRAHAKGETSLEVSVNPKAAPTPNISNNPKTWQVTQETHTHTWNDSQYGHFTWPVTDLDIAAPTVETSGDWYLNNFFFLNLVVPDPTETAIKVTAFSYNSPGGAYPAGTQITIALEQGCPIPCLFSQVCFDISSQPYWADVAPVRASFSFIPTGIYGSECNKTILTGYMLPHTEEGRLGESYPWVEKGVQLDLFDPATETWKGLGGHGPLRGLSNNDYLRMPESDIIYRATRVVKNKLENPSGVYLNKRTHPLVKPITNNYGVDIGGKVEHYPMIYTESDKEGFRGDIYFVPFCPWSAPSGQTAGLPMIINSIVGNTVNLIAPLPCDIPSGTRIDVYSSSDNDVVTYSYYDYYEFKYQVAKYNKVQFELTRDYFNTNANRLVQLLEKVQAYYAEAKIRAARFWLAPPYNRLVTLRECLWSSEFTDFGDTYPEVITTIETRLAAITALANIGTPSIEYVEYLSLLDYGRH